MILADIVIWGVLFAYFTSASFVYHVCRQRDAFCTRQGRGCNPGDHTPTCDAKLGWLGMAVFWPCCAPFMGGKWAASLVGRKERQRAALDRRIMQQERELGMGVDA